MFGKLKWLGLFILVLVVGSGIYFLNEALPIGTGYSAKYVCSQVFLADRDPKVVFENEVKPTHPLFAPVKIKVDRKKKQVTAAAFGFWKPMTAVYREGCGCTLVVDTTREQLLNQAENIEPRTVKRSSKPWPFGFTVDMSNMPENVDHVKLNRALDDAFKEPGPDTMRNTQAIVVVLGNKIIAEQYAKGFDKDTPMLGWSMSKSVINAFTGVLVKKKRLDIMAPALVDAWKGKTDPRADITLDMLLRMSSGLEFEEVYGPFKDATYMLYTSNSMADYAKAKPLVFEPNTHWYYSSGTTNIIAQILKIQTGGTPSSTIKFFNKNLFDKIDMHSALIEVDASGAFVGSSYMFATARDWARFGLFIKNGGVWNGEQILPEGWVKYSITPTPEAPLGQYGAQFWLNAGARDNPSNRLYPGLPRDLAYLGGFNEQIVAIIPSKDMVIVRLGVTHDDSWDDEVFIKSIFNAIKF